ncbi:putative apoptosis-inducing taf9-like domain 1 family [Diaporthe ampelina]|uniref:Putative apoptosis-inducing taf9-like domain 1 family n=1 Tax=Diaporthe ampelina TaxID=1214573 RepID=A0A0G2F7D3_9PEZI|nr:putative apoptosis-inducing taf9-like domain 1 family [Diaporthe ampelina]
MADQPEEDVRERLKAALWFAVGKMVDEQSLRRNRNATPQFIGALTEMVWTQIGGLSYVAMPPRQPRMLTNRAENVAIDLESFSRHAGRTSITTDDVLLLARRNADLNGIIKDFVDEQKAAKVSKGKGKAKR